MKVLCAADNPETILEIGAAENVRGLYFLDVDLGPDAMNGFELAKVIRERDPRGYLVFITTHDELLLETFKMRLEAMDYILKDDMSQVDIRIRHCIEETINRVIKEQMEIGEYYTIKIFDDLYHIPVSETLYFETSQENTALLFMRIAIY
ncbi:response regulator [Erysipelothrix piscisicarius]|uniref:response regulator n=1 Tax=Erysipelothrix piscisicarius TaxID=2485784 RepID=UPI00225DD195|nr:response regulator [Erysipelothrix piscisicarius]